MCKSCDYNNYYIMLTTVMVCRGEEFDEGGYLDNAASLQSQVGVLPPMEA